MSKLHDLKTESSREKTIYSVSDHLEDLYKQSTIGFAPAQYGEVAKLLNKHQSTFSETDEDQGRTRIIRHRIPTGNATPIKQPVRRLPVHMNMEAEKQINDMLQKDVIQPPSSPWFSGTVMVQKQDETKRFCVDYRRHNDVTINDAYSLPRIDDFLNQLSGAEWFSSLDRNSGYWQVEANEEDREKTGII